MQTKKFIIKLLELLSQATGCDIQHKGCPCRTCFYNLCENLGLTSERATHFWRIVLILRGDYSEQEISNYETEGK